MHIHPRPCPHSDIRRYTYPAASDNNFRYRFSASTVSVQRMSNKVWEGGWEEYNSTFQQAYA